MGLAFALTFSLNGTDWFTISIGLILGGFFFVFGVLVILSQVTNFVKITSDKIIIRNSLKKYSFSLRSSLKVRIRFETVYVRINKPGSGSYWRTVELFLAKDDIEYRMLDFSVSDMYSADANKLGADLLQKIKKRINRNYRSST